jgi:biopolymer transport protein ExbD
MNLRRRHRIAPEVSTASLNDIMFFLLLFFLIVSTLVNPNVIKLMLPRASSGQTVSKQPVTVSITKDLQYFINNKPVNAGELSNALSAAVQGITEPTAVLRVDNSIAVQELVTVLDIGKKLKIKMILATNTAKG